MKTRIVKDYVWFSCERMKKYLGEWHVEVRALGEGELIEGAESGVQHMLEKLCDKAGCIRMSRGIIRDGRIIVIEGPLQGMEPYIRKIDRHKRLARVELPGMFMGERFIEVGLEIYAKN